MVNSSAWLKSAFGKSYTDTVQCKAHWTVLRWEVEIPIKI